MTNKYKIQLRDREPFFISADNYFVGDEFTSFNIEDHKTEATPVLVINNVEVIFIQLVSKEMSPPDFFRRYIEREITITHGKETVNLTIESSFGVIPSDRITYLYMPSFGGDASTYTWGE